MTYYNCIVYTDYGKNVIYHDVTKLDALVEYLDNHLSWVKIFVYQKANRKATKGKYVMFRYANNPAMGWADARTKKK